jgi:UDP-2,3-diacylglucosamine pyrophosphatase LpxH
MFIFISDLHFMDGTAGKHYVDAGVFASTMHDIAAHVREARATDVTLAFLGDVYDLYRTERWFDQPLEVRPWGEAPSEDVLFDIFEGVVAENGETFEMLSGSLAERFDFPVEPKRLFIPGNHDRLVNEFPQLRRRVRETLGMGTDDSLFPHHLLDEEHGVFARHGHEWDPFSFEGSATLDAGEEIEVPDEDYRRMPVADPMGCEFASKLAPLVLEHLGSDHPAAQAIAEHMRAIVDVRPLEAAMRWAAWQVAQFDEFESGAISRAISDAARGLRAIPFVESWLDKHDRLGIDRADFFQVLTRCLQSFEVLEYERVLGILDEVSAEKRDIDPEVAVRDFARLDRHPEIGQNIYYLFYGHTHAAEQQPVGVIGSPPDERYRIYFNTGTWRPVHRPLAAALGGFASWKEMTYVLVHRPGEVISGGTTLPYPAAESWTGSVVGARGRSTTMERAITHLARKPSAAAGS